MGWVDLAISLVLVLAAVRGWWMGASRQISVFAGLWAGLVVGALTAPEIARLAPVAVQGYVAVTLLVVFGLAFATGGDVLGRRMARRLDQRRLRVADRVAGVAVGAMAALLAFWLVGNLLADTTVPSLDRALRDSTILAETNRFLPPVPDVFTRLQGLLSKRGFPLVFSNAPRLLQPVPPGSPAEVGQAVAAAGPSTVKVSGPACGITLVGSGFVVRPGLVVTNAHVVAGDPHPRVADARGVHRAVPVLFDPRLDVAVLEVPGLTDPALPIDNARAPRGATATVLGYPGGGDLTAAPAGIDGSLSALGFDIYNERLVTRDVYQLNAHIQAGDSGGPLVDITQEADSRQRAVVIGLVFARSLTYPDIGYALTIAEVEKDLRAAESTHSAVSTQRCAT